MKAIFDSVSTQSDFQSFIPLGLGYLTLGIVVIFTLLSLLISSFGVELKNGEDGVHNKAWFYFTRMLDAGTMGGDEGFGGDGETEIEEQGELAEQRLAAFGCEDPGPAVVLEGSQRLAEAVKDLAGDLVQLG